MDVVTFTGAPSFIWMIVIVDGGIQVGNVEARYGPANVRVDFDSRRSNEPRLIEEGTITERLARELIKEYVSTGESPRALVERRGLASAGRDELGEAIREVLSDNRKAVADYRAGRARALDYLLGQVLRRIRARGDPVEVKRLIREVLDSD